MKRAFISGITGQDGSLLAELLLSKGYQVDGLVRRLSVPNRHNLGDIIGHNALRLVEGDLEDSTRISGIIKEGQYDEVYNLGAMSFVHYSFTNPVQTAHTNYLGNVYLLDAIMRDSPGTKFYQASTSEMYGGVACPPDGYDENSPFHPRSPYGIAKLAAYWNTRGMRDGYGIFACNGILFNHESPRRGSEFVTQKVAEGVANVDAALKANIIPNPIQLGNLEAARDWGHAKDYVRGMYLIMQQGEPDDYVLATGTVHTIRELCEVAFDAAGWQLEWGCGGLSAYVRLGDGQLMKVLETNSSHMRPTEVDRLLGNPAKARSIGWEPDYGFKSLIQEMVAEAILRHGS